MDDRNFILGVLAAQAGFVTPAQVIAAGSARMLARDGRSVLDHLVDSGALTPERRDLVAALATEALAASGGTPERVLESLPGGRALARTLGSELAADAAAASPGDGDVVPVEREGQYARLDELGRGGQSIVWRALDRFVGREVALKELTSGPGQSSGSTRAAHARFLREARLTAQLDHPGIATILELARRPDGTLYSAQKLVRGRTLKAALAQCRTLSQRLELLPHLVNAAQTMAYAHTRAVVHRDLKPSNVMVGPYGETVVVDWGLAKRRGEAEPASDAPSPDLGPELTQAGVALGTPSYMSPEQARGDLQAIDERSDVFSLGAMLYELLTGRPPFQGLDNAQVIEAVRSGHIAPVRVVCLEAPPELAAIAERALRREAAERYPDAAAFASELLAYRAGARVEAYSYGSLELVRKFVQRNPALSVAISASVLILIGAAVAIALQLRQARVNLGSALVERARRAEDVSDWGRAAAYYAASRLQNDTTAARWGLALARERMPERGTVLTGEPGAFTDVDVLPDGTVVALETRANLARLYDAATGRSLWTAQMAEPIQRARITSGAIRLLSGHLYHILDEHTGQELFTSDEGREKLCKNGPATRRGRIEHQGVVHVEGAEGPRIDVLHVEGAEGPRIEVYPRDACAISQDGARMAVRDLQGLVRLWDLDGRREVTSRPAPDAQDMVFTEHGVALVRSTSLQLFGGPEGDFSVEVPGLSASGFANVPAGRGLAVSPNGHRVVVDSPTLNRADVVDLRDRAVFVSVSRPPGDPSYAFSPDGSKLYAAGLSGGRTLISWNLRRLEGSASGSAGSRVYLRAARDRFILWEPRRRVELRAEDGTLLRTLDVPGAQEVTISRDGSTLAIAYPQEIAVQRADDGRELARASCERCLVLLLSENGSRVVGFSRERRRVWDVDGPRLVRDEPLGGVSLTAPKTLSPSGDRMAWCENDGVVLEDVSTGSLTRLALPETPKSTSISPDGTLLVVSLPASFGLWTLPGLERVWAVPNPSSVPTAVGWSADGSIVTVAYEGAGALLLDARTGEALARIVEGRAGAGASQVNVLPSLRYRLARGGHSWSLFPLPEPDRTAPAESLRRTLAESGFRLRGVELEVVSP
jgi:serine/threonine protein kinase/WD40 repeat protein